MVGMREKVDRIVAFCVCIWYNQLYKHGFDEGVNDVGLFDLFKKKQSELTEEQQKWNKMWQLWAEEKSDRPYAQLMTYQSEVNNGGHVQYFTNIENTGDLQEERSVLASILPRKLADNLHKAYQAYLLLEKAENHNADETIARCDRVFYESEEEINHILQEYANKINL